MSEQAGKFETWAIVEVMGHKKLAGWVTEQTIAGAALVRVDVPDTPADERYGVSHAATEKYTKLIGVGSIYMLTPCSEEIARRAAREIERHNDPIPVTLPAVRQLVAAGPVEDAEIEMEDEEEDDLPFDEGVLRDHPELAR
jgi:hypothetical protein